MIPAEKISITRSERKNIPKMYSTNSPARLGMKLLMNWKPPKNRKNSPDQKIALQITIIESRSLDPVRRTRKPVAPSRHRRHRNAEATWAGVLSRGGIGAGVVVIGRVPATGPAAARPPAGGRPRSA